MFANRVSVWSGIAALAAIGGTAAFSFLTYTPAKPTLPAVRVRSTPPPKLGARTNDPFATLSCAGAACHGAAPEGALASSSALSIFTTWDPHATSPGRMYSEESRAIVERLVRRPMAPVDAVGDRPMTEEGYATFVRTKCVSCHGDIPTGASQAMQGVACAACHGDPRGWYAAHQNKSIWRELGNKESLGFCNTLDLEARATKCAECHVGRPGAEVTHDLIAAGHPRLHFEFDQYLARLPAHWDVAADHARSADFDWEAWSVGKKASARATLLLLEAHARNGEAWPELADFNCYACHHELSRNKSGLPRPSKPSQPPGRLTLNDWHLSWPAWVADETGETAFAKLFGEIRSPKSTIDGVAQFASQAREAVDGGRLAFSKAGVRSGLVKRSLPELNWDEAAQWYSGARALIVPEPHAADATLRPLLEALMFPSSEPASTGDNGVPQRYSSPGQYGWNQSDEASFLGVLEAVKAIDLNGTSEP